VGLFDRKYAKFSFGNANANAITSWCQLASHFAVVGMAGVFSKAIEISVLVNKVTVGAAS